MKIKTVAKAILLDSNYDVLLLRRSKTDPRRPEEWDFAGGNVDEGEDITEAAIREISEEAGIDLNHNDLRLVYCATSVYQPTNESINRLLYVGKVKPKVEIKLSYEHDQYKWVDIGTALKLFPHPFYATGLRYARDNGLIEK